MITVKDLITYLKQYPEDTEVALDKDGWPEEEWDTESEIIKQSGLFYYYKDKDDRHPPVLFINN